jgi:hypothetical protein
MPRRCALRSVSTADTCRRSDIQPDLLLLAISQALIKYTKYAMHGDFLELAQASEIG